MKFKIGDRVQCTDAYNKNTQGEYGEIIAVAPFDEEQMVYAVVFDNNVHGHSFCGDKIRKVPDSNCPKGHGWWCLEKDLRLVNKHRAEELLNILK